MKMRSARARLDALEKVSPTGKLPVYVKVYIDEDGTYVQLPADPKTHPVTAPTYKKFKKKMKHLHGKKLCIVIINQPTQLPPMDGDGIPLEYEGKVQEQQHGEGEENGTDIKIIE